MVVKDLKAGFANCTCERSAHIYCSALYEMGNGRACIAMDSIVALFEQAQLAELLWHVWPALIGVGIGLGCYALSMACWVMALKHLPLGVAYPLLSLSYVIVYLLAVTLPWLNESFSWVKLSGIGFILLGLTFIFTAKKSSH